MQSRLLLRSFNSALSFVCGMLAIGLGSASTSAAEPGLASVQNLTFGGRTVTLEVSQNEYMYVARDGRRELRSIAAQPTAEAMRQAALNVEQTTGGQAWLVMYPQGQPRDRFNRHVLTPDLLVHLDENADPNVVSANMGITYSGSLQYFEGRHVYRARGTGRVLDLLPSVALQPGVLSAEPVFSRTMVSPLHIPNDPLFTNQWHLLNTGQNGATVGSDVNITNAWERFRGSNVFLAVFDDGFDLTHPDLRDNLRTNMALNPFDGTQDVTPRAGDFHGTAVTGVAAARGDNNEGLTGSAPNADIVPIRFDFNNGLTPLQIADGLLHSNNVVQVHNNSWGIPTFGFKYVLDPAESNAFEMANRFGRGGLGSIFVYAAGNTGDVGDDVNYSGYQKDMTTISVIALNDLGDRASYSTFGAASVISAPSGRDATRAQGTSTTDIQGTNGYNPNQPAAIGEYTNLNYTAGFNGTSSAAPLASGVIALMMDANPNLGWRDVQEILIRSANLTDTNNGGWMTNAAGFHFNNEYGAGIINADGATQLAEGWTNLGLRTNVVASATALNGLVSDAAPFSHTFTFTNTEFRIEHIQLRTDINHPIRGDLQIVVTAPSGMRSIMSRVHSDFNPDWVWEFNSVFHWGEIAAGDWTVDVVDLRPGANGVVNDLALEFFGSISNAVFVSLTNPPSVLNHPLSRTATKGSDVLFRVNAIGSGQLNYRWLFNGQELSGQNAATLIVNDVTPLQQGTYHARIDNQFGTIISAGASLFVNSPPEITLQPTAQMANIGDSVTMNVAAVGNSPLLYQWRLNGTPIPNENSTSLTISNVQPASIGNYDVVVQNPLSSIISDLAFVSANTPVVFSGAQLGSGPGAAFMFNFSGATGATFRVDGSIDLRTWSPLSTNTLSTGTSSFSDGAAGTFTNRYYRVVPVP